MAHDHAHHDHHDPHHDGHAGHHAGQADHHGGHADHHDGHAEGDDADDAARQLAVAWHSARWLPVAYRLVRPHLPPAPATVVDVGCGPFGGIVAALVGDGYDASGVDPGAPSGPRFRPEPFAEADVPTGIDAITASLSLHHVTDVEEAAARAAEVLAPDGTIVVLEMDWPAFDDTAAEWCFARLPAPDTGVPAGWLASQRENWMATDVSWSEYRTDWATEHGLHPWDRVRAALDAHFECVETTPIPYYFSQLVDGVTPEAELAAVEARELPAAAFRYVGRPR